MAEKLFGLTAGQVQRVGRVVATVEGKGPDPVRGRSDTSAPTGRFWIELTAEDTANPGRYKWKLVDYVDHTWTTRDPAIDSGADYTALEANQASGLTGRRYEVVFSGYDAAGKPQYLFTASSASLIPVTVATDGGSDGTTSTAPSYTYTATSLGGLELGTSLSPAWARSKGSFTAATHGTGYFDAAGDFVLYQVDEVEATEPACDEDE